MCLISVFISQFLWVAWHYKMIFSIIITLHVGSGVMFFPVLLLSSYCGCSEVTIIPHEV